MSIAVVVITHGNAATELLYSAKMIVGDYQNVGCIHFLTEDNGETLTAKIEQTLAKLDRNHGVLFLVDLWGGTPFNSAGRFLAKRADYQVVTGVNVPMLVNVLFEREKTETVEQLAELAAQSGIHGVKQLTLSRIIDAPLQTTGEKVSSGKHMKLVLTRIDDRLVHGKVINTWLKVVQANRIIVVNDAAAEDSARIELFQQTAPKGINTNVIKMSELIDIYNQEAYAEDRVLLLFTCPTDVLTAIQLGLPIKTVNIGSIAKQEGSIYLTPAVAVNQEDVAALKALAKQEVILDLRTVPRDESPDIWALLKK